MKWSHPERQVTGLFLLLATMVTLLSSGCIESYQTPQTLRPTTERLVIQHTSGGTHYHMLFDGQAWYQLFGSELLVMNPVNGRIIDRQVLSKIGGHAPATDMILYDDELWVVLQDVGVVRLSLEDPFRPWIEEMIPAGELGIKPRHVHAIEQGVVVSGVGGVVDPITRQQLVDTDGEVRSVIDMSEGPVYCEGRRIYRVHHSNKNDESYLGSASELHQLPKATPWGDGAIVFVRHEANGSLVGIMGEDLRELDAERSTVAIPGQVRQVRYEGGQLVVVSDTSVRMYKHRDGKLFMDREFPLSGTHDASIVSESRLAVSGDFGRGTIRLNSDIDGETGSIDLFFPEAAGLTRAVSDGRNILAESSRGAWLYRIGQSAKPATAADRQFPPPVRKAVTLGWQAKILEDGTQVEVTTPIGRDVLHAPDKGYFRCVAAGEGVIWLGHDTGIVMIRLPNEAVELPSDWEEMTREQRVETGLGPLEGMTKLSIRLDGPVIFLDPLMLGGGVAYVSYRGGFGVVAEELE